MIFNKKGEEMEDQILGIAFLFILVIIVVGIALGTSLYFGSGYESKQAEADNLNYQVENCFATNNIYNIQNNFYSTCGINESIVENYSLMIKVCQGTDVGGCVNNKVPFMFFGTKLEVDCYLIGASSNNAYPRCDNSTVVNAGEAYTIITGSNQQIRRESA